MILPLISAFTSVVAILILKDFTHASSISSATSKAPYLFKVIALASNQYTEWLNPLFFLRTTSWPNGDIIGYFGIFAAGFHLTLSSGGKSNISKSVTRILFSTLTTVSLAAIVAGDLVLATISSLSPWIYLLIVYLLPSSSSLQRSVLLIAILFLTASIFTLGSTPTLPDYPAGSYLVPLTGFAGFPRPLIGPAPPLQLIDRGWIKAVYFWPAVIGLISTTYLLLLSKMRGTPTAPTSILPILLFLSASLDTVLPETYAVIAPLQTISRLFPGASFISFTPILVLCGYLFLLVSLFNLSCYQGTFSLLLITVAGITFAQQHYTENPLLPLKECSNLHSTYDTTAENYCSRELVSPSYRIYQELGYKRTANIYRRWAARSAPVPNLSQLFASNDAPAETLNLMIDRNPKTRWSSGGGKQKGDEWLLLLLPASHRLAGVDLQTTRYYTDFPRGVTVFTSRQCFLPEELAKITKAEVVKGAALHNYGFTTTFARSEWVGPIIFAPDGSPAYGRQGDVRLQFDQTADTCSILIRQTGKVDGFDWSVAEIKLLEGL